MIDRRRVGALLDRIAAELDGLDDIAARADEELRTDPHLLAAAKYRLIVAIEAATDVADHVIAVEGLRTSDSFADSFRSLEESGWLAAALSTSLQDAARFRNLLVHQYARIDDGRVIEIVRTRTADLRRYRREMAGRIAETA